VIGCLGDRLGSFYKSSTRGPDDIRKLGPWQSLKRGELDRLKTHYRLQLAEQGFVVIHQSMGTFSPEPQSG
jgi:hypothetical protein